MELLINLLFSLPYVISLALTPVLVSLLLRGIIHDRGYSITWYDYVNAVCLTMIAFDYGLLKF